MRKRTQATILVESGGIDMDEAHCQRFRGHVPGIILRLVDPVRSPEGVSTVFGRLSCLPPLPISQESPLNGQADAPVEWLHPQPQRISARYGSMAMHSSIWYDNTTINRM